MGNLFVKVPQRPRSEALQALYAEKGEELSMNLTKQTSPMYCIPSEANAVKRIETETFRPVQAPPLPPHHNHVLAKNNALSDNRDKPLLAVKPSSVKDIAARFDPKTSQVSTKFI
ncbi:unnamed protein product [Brugia timori]|uniref:ZM domain-containing protein n=1 Tax=Brugia timori TaxID=42155 RepID=A0A0R3QXE9_9BILA|nr:unnamed protein product [Brugia timori]